MRTPHLPSPDRISLLARAVLVLLILACLPAETEAQYFRFGKNKVQYEADTWYYVQSKHFDVYYYKGGEHLANYTAKAAEEAYAQIADLFQHQISDRIPLIVYQSHNDFAVTNAVNLPTYSEGIGGVTELFKNRVAIPFTGDYRDYRRVVHHELVHAVINDMFYGGSIQSVIQNNIQLRIPLWFNEGLAEYAALGWDTNSDMFVREAVLEDNLAPIPYLSGYFAYRGGQSVWDYVAEQYGEQKIGEILQRLRVTRSVEAAFKRSTGLDLEELSERWQKALKEVYYPELAAREDLDEIARPILTRENAGYMNTSPALSPRGDKVAFISTKDRLFDVYLASANDGEILKKLVDGQTSPEFESLRILSPGLTWSPDGTQVALAVKSGPSDAIALVDVQTGAATHYRIPDIDQIVTVAWSPDGQRIAFEGSMDAQSDIYVLDLETRATTNYTSDVFSDHEPAWSPDGQSLLFHSDRGAYTMLGHHQADTFEMVRHDYSQFDVYRLPLGAQKAERLTFDERWDEHSAKFGGSADRILFLSDRNGIPNLYEKHLTTGVERPLTDVGVGIMQVSLSADGQKAALVSLKEGAHSIYLLKTPFERQMERDELVPNVWAQRVMQETRQPAPALALALASRRQSNPFLRDASDGAAYQRRPDVRWEELLASRTPLPFLAEADEGDDYADGTNGQNRSTASATDAQGTSGTNGDSEAASDTTAYGDLRVDFRNYVFSDAFDEAAGEDVPDVLARNRFNPRENMDEDGDYTPRRYKLKFSPDLVYGTAGYSSLYGVQGVTQMMFSDMLGNHQIFVATNLLIDLRNSDYLLSYNYLPRRVDWSVSAFHISRLLLDANLRVYRYRWYGGGVAGSYPLDKFRRIDLDLSVMGVSQADVRDPSLPSESRTLFHPTLTYTKDITTPGFLYPLSGYRYALSLSGSPGSLSGGQVQFATLLGDARAYTSFGGGRYSFAVRGSAAGSVGPNQQLFYTSGVQNWINRDIDDDNGFPIDDVTDFVFATQVLPVRGYEINARNGSYFWLVNGEFRFPLIAAVLPGPIPVAPLYNLQGSAFLDVGGVWGGRNRSNKRFNVFRDDPATGDRVFDDLLLSAGLGLRTILFGYPIRLDWAWPHNGQGFQGHQFHFSVGLDF